MGQVLGATNPTGHWELFYTNPIIIAVRCLLVLPQWHSVCMHDTKHEALELCL